MCVRAQKGKQKLAGDEAQEIVMTLEDDAHEMISG
jgi:hypothetical protein